MKINKSAEIPAENGHGPLTALVGKEPEARFPQLTLEGEESLNLPPTGTLTVEYKRVRETNEDRGGDHYYVCTLEVRKLIEVKPAKGESAPSKSDTSTGDALDKLAQANSDGGSDEGGSEGY